MTGTDDDQDDGPFVPLTAYQLGIAGVTDDADTSNDAARYTPPAEDVQP